MSNTDPTEKPLMHLNDFVEMWQKALSDQAAKIADLERKLAEAYGKGVSAGKQEALNYTPEERSAYGKHVASHEQWRELRAFLGRCQRLITELHPRVFRQTKPPTAEEWRDILNP